MEKRKSFYTQWASQFYVAAELTRRKHLVSLPLGNAEEIDVMTMNPKGCPIVLDVKGQSKKNFWLIRKRAPKSNYFFVLVYLPPNVEHKPTFWIMSSYDVMKLRDDYEKHIKGSGGNYRDELGGFNFFTAPSPHENNWEILERETYCEESRENKPIIPQQESNSILIRALREREDSTGSPDNTTQRERLYTSVASTAASGNASRGFLEELEKRDNKSLGKGKAGDKITKVKKTE
jgi:hypothetical protein